MYLTLEKQCYVRHDSGTSSDWRAPVEYVVAPKETDNLLPLFVKQRQKLLNFYSPSFRRSFALSPSFISPWHRKYAKTCFSLCLSMVSESRPCAILCALLLWNHPLCVINFSVLQIYIMNSPERSLRFSPTWFDLGFVVCLWVVVVVLSGSMGKSSMMVCKKRKKLQLIGQLITILTACTIPKCEGKPLRISSCFFRFGVCV